MANSPVQKIVVCHDCGYMVYSRDTFFKRDFNKHPVYCGKCGSRDFIEIICKGYHLIICRKAEQIERAVKVLANMEDIPDAFISAFRETDIKHYEH